MGGGGWGEGCGLEGEQAGPATQADAVRAQSVQGAEDRESSGVHHSASTRAFLPPLAGKACACLWQRGRALSAAHTRWQASWRHGCSQAS